MSLPDFEFEEKHYSEGYTAICGCDEAGRGPLCGPVVAAAVILPRGIVIDGLNDSKKRTEKKREVLFDVICEKLKECEDIIDEDVENIQASGRTQIR